MVRTIYYEAGNLYILDQTRLPGKVEYVRMKSHLEVARAVKGLLVRGAPLIGVTAAFGLFLAVRNYSGKAEGFQSHYEEAERLLAETRPTAVNLFWAIARMRSVVESSPNFSAAALADRMLTEAQAMYAEDVAANQRLGQIGKDLLPPQARVLTHCNAGALATCGYGTALGVVRAAHQEHKIRQVWACETRPVLQGARLTVWELMQDKIPVALITDSMAAHLMKSHAIDAVIVGADRVAANGDTANKIGTYGLAVAACYHRIPFYVAAPLSSIDMQIPSGREIVIEERDPDEIRLIHGQYITLPEAKVYNPAFDVTPADLITAIITEAGLVKTPFSEGLQAFTRKRD